MPYNNLWYQSEISMHPQVSLPGENSFKVVAT